MIDRTLHRGPPGRSFLWLPLVAMAVWWPISPSWQSDDYIALHYARDFVHVLHDFVGPQYGATDIWLFYRPLITLSFWFDQWVGGPWPPLSHFSNVLAHGMSALLVALLWRRFLPDDRAFFAGVLWAVMPSHVGSLQWAVGRVDSHTTVWCLLTLWTFVRHDERVRAGHRSSIAACLATFAAALASKEMAIAVAPLAIALAAMLAPIGPIPQRLRTATARALPLLGVLAGYMALRWLALGGLGGYEGMRLDAASILHGLPRVTADLLVPLRWMGLEALRSAAHGTAWPWVAAAPIALAAIGLLAHPRWLAAVGCYVVAILPMAPFLAGADNPQTLRYYYFPTVALVGLLARPGKSIALLVLSAWAWPTIAVRLEQVRTDRESAAMHRALLAQCGHGDRTPMFVAGLPHANRAGTSVQFHFGVDRLLQPPFVIEGRPVYALRPIAELPGVVRLQPPDRPPTALPGGSTWRFAEPGTLRPASAPETLPELVIDGDADGELDLTSRRLRERRQRALVERTGTADLTTGPGRPELFRLTIFTAIGYLSCVFPDHGPAGATHGTIDLLQFLGGDAAIGVAPEHSRIAASTWAPGAHVLTALQVPTTHDLDPSFPVLLEAGDSRAGSFVARQRANRLLRFRFDRDYPAWVRWALHRL